MLAVFFGNDIIKVRSSAFDFVEGKKGDDVEVVSISGDNFEPGSVRLAAASGTLFGGSSVVVIDSPRENKELSDELVNSLTELAGSENIFVVIEGPLLAAEKKVYEKVADHFEEYKKAAGVSFNNFALADALLKRDKKLLWLLLSEARLQGAADEELIGILWWQLKTLRLVATGQSAEAVGLKDFPYGKAKRGLAKFAPGELEQLSHELLRLLHNSRLGRVELDVELERFVLSI